jgi:predicted lipoprotein with Yx(FWY)xxD motif
MSFRILLAALLVGGSALAADPPTTPPTVITRPVFDGVVNADVQGRTLYAPESGACDAACSTSWKPFAAAWIAGPVGDWTIVGRKDGARQWAYKGKPVYTFHADQRAGDMKGEGAEGRWRALYHTRKFMPANVVINNLPFSNLGPAFVTKDGKTLYMLVQFRFNPLGTQRHSGTSTNPGAAACGADCLPSWLPLKAPTDAAAADDWTVVTRDDGTRQWAWKGWPLYTYAQDKAFGDALGEAKTLYQDSGTGLQWEVATLP